MSRTHFYHTVWKKNATTGSVEPLAGVECEPRNVGANGSIGGSAVPVFTSRTGSTEPASMLTNANGVISFFCDPAEYSMIFTDTIIPARISSFTVGHSGVNGADTGIDADQLPQSLQDQLDSLTESIATISDALTDVYARLPQPGDMMVWCGTGGKVGWFICDGSIMDRDSYPVLFSKIGTAFNTGGETSDQFRIPDMRGRTIFGADDSDVRLTTLNARGNTGGTETRQLTATHLPFGGKKAGVGAAIGSLPHGSTADSSSPFDINYTGAFAQIQGDDTPFSIMNPYTIANWVIKHDEAEIGDI